jgi:hypothetical protein
MKKPLTVAALNDFGRIRLSKSFFMRDFLYSEIASIEKIPNIPDDPDLAIETGRHLCEELLEPLQDTFGRLAIRGSLRCAEVNGLGNLRQRQGKPGYACSTNEATAANHIWDRQDAYGFKGAMACVVVPWFADRYAQGGFTTICPTRNCAFSRSLLRSICHGTSARSGGSTAISRRKAA